MKTVRALLSFVSCHPFDKLRMTLSVPKGQLLVVIFFAFFLSLLAIHYSLFTKEVYAQSAPNPVFCQKNETDKLTDNYVTNDNGNPPIVVTNIPVTGTVGESVTIPLDEWFTVDFSQLQAIFGATNSDYLEGKFQDKQHRTKNLLDLKSAAFNLFHGPGQKTTPKPLVDDLRIKYVDYVYNHPNLPEASFTYTDIKNEGDPKTVYDLVGIYQLPDKDPNTPEPTPPSWGGDKEVWENGWGKYWEKIPTAYSEFYTGELQFKGIAGEKQYTLVKEGKLCPGPTRTPIKFVMPEFFRTTSISDQLNQVIVPCAAQSWRHGTTEQEDQCGAKAAGSTTLNNQTQPDNFLSKTVNFCKNLITGPPKKLLRQLQKAIQTSFNLVQPLKNVYAADPPSTASPSPTSCIKVLAPGKEGTAPYCALPFDQQFVNSREHCYDKPSASDNKLDKDNPRVICLFYAGNLKGTIEDQNLSENSIWDSCTPNPGGTYTCTTTVRIWPVFRIPYLSEIWNNTMYSNEEEGAAGAGVGSHQETGRPGIYSNFTPKAIYAELFEGGIITQEEFQRLQTECIQSGNLDSDPCNELWAALEELHTNYPDITDSCPEPIERPSDLTACFGAYWGSLPSKNLPGQAADNVAGAKTSVLGTTSGDAKDRFIGATDCNKFFTRDIALKPKALQEELGINSQQCNLLAAVNPPSPPTPANCPPTFNLNPHQTTVEELQCYIVSRASGQIEPISGEDLARVMLNVMNDESGGDQCSTAGAGEIGVFQYIASTWHSFHSDEVDSGSINSPCWGNPGTDPYPTSPPAGYDINLFLWPSNYHGTNDGDAWNPFKQIDTTISIMANKINGGACNWSTFQLRYGGC